MTRRLRFVFVGLSLSSSWGNGHATTYRALLGALHERSHDILFLERDRPWYARNRDLGDPDYCRLEFYADLRDLRRYSGEIASADAVIVGSYVPDGVAVARFVLRTAKGIKAFYDIDTPVTLAKLAAGDFEYVSPAVIPRFDLYLSFSAGPALDVLERRYRARAARALYCSVDVNAYRPRRQKQRYDLGYLGTYSDDRQPALERLLLAPARRMPDLRFIVAGPLYPPDIDWPGNVHRVEHVPPEAHAEFYGGCRFTLNVTRSDMIRLGYSPSVRLFEAAAAGTPIISDVWDGIDTFFEPQREIALAQSAEDVCRILTGWSERQRRELARNARSRVLSEHTSLHRARQLEQLLLGAPAERADPLAAADALPALA
jgi:spore maturation protein CgeB